MFTTGVPSVRQRRGRLLVLSGPSGVGKTTLARALVEYSGGGAGGVVRSVSVTTRPPRPGEVNGLDYCFVSVSRFAEMVARAELLEHTEAFGHRYGTPGILVESHLAASNDVVLVLDGHGRRQLAERCPGDVVSVFLLPPSLTELQRRLRGRVADSNESLAQRLASAEAEIGCAEEYDHVLVSGDPETILRALEAARLTGRSRREGAQLAVLADLKDVDAVDR